MSTDNPMPPAGGAVLYCSRCGAAVKLGDAFCSKCSAPQTAAPAQAPPVVYGTSAVPARRVSYAGFWIRFAAWLLDAIIIGIVFTPVQMAVFGFMGATASMSSMQEDPTRLVAVMVPALGMIMLLNLGGQWLYEALMTSSSKQATIGKMACGLRVTDLQGQRLTFARATGRYFAKVLSSFTLLIGYIIAGLTERKQALHDFIAGTYVLKG